MTRRERVLATTMVILLTVLGGAAGFHFFVYEPYSDATSQLRTAQEQLSKKRTELAQEEAQIKGVLRVNPRLSQWHKISLPPRDPETKKLVGDSPEERKRGHHAKLQVDYERYLSELMRASGFRGDSIAISQATPDTKTKLNTPKGKEPTFERLAFSVAGKGNKDAVVKMLAAFHKEPLLHQIRKLTVAVATNPGGATAGRRGGQGAGEGTLDVHMTVEALMVQGAEERANLKPAPLSYPPRVLAEPGRDYQALARRNMFTGVAPPRIEMPARTTEDRADVLRFVKLTTLYYDPERDRWEGTLYDQATGPVRVDEQDEDGNTIKKVKWEKKLNTRLLSDLKVPDKHGNMLLDAKVVHIDEKQLIFKVDNSFFRLRCGDALYPAIERPLAEDAVKELGLAE